MLASHQPGAAAGRGAERLSAIVEETEKELGVEQVASLRQAD